MPDITADDVSVTPLMGVQALPDPEGVPISQYEMPPVPQQPVANIAQQASAQQPVFVPQQPQVNAAPVPDGNGGQLWSLESLKQLHAEREKQLARLEQINQQEAAERAKLQPELDRRRKDAMDSFGRPLDAELKQEQVPQAPQGPIIDPKSFADFGKIAFPFVLLLGKAMRADGTQALNALSHSVLGFQRGSEQKAEHDYNNYKAKFEEVLAKNKQNIEKYRATMERRDLENEQKLMLVKLQAAAVDDVATAHSAEHQSIQQVLQHIDKQEQAWTKAYQAHETLTRNLEDKMNQRKSQKEIAQIHADAIRDAATIRERGMAGRAAQKTADKAAKTAKASAKEAADNRAFASAIDDLDSLINKVKQNPNIVGPRGWVTGILEGVRGLPGMGGKGAGDTPQHSFEAAKKVIEVKLQKDLAGRLSVTEYHAIKSAVGSLNWDDSPEVVVNKLNAVKEILQRRVSMSGQSEGRSLPYFESPDDLKRAIQNGTIQPGDYFDSPSGRRQAK